MGELGPFPDMYDPTWSRDKSIAVVGQAVAVLAAAALMLTTPRRRGRGARVRSSDHYGFGE